MDIRSRGIFALLVENSLKETRIDGRMHVPFADVPEPSEEVDAAEGLRSRLSAALGGVAEAMDLSGAETIVTIPAAWVSFRNFQVPFKDRRKIRQVLPFELEPLLPYPVDEMAIDFQIVQPAEKTDILVSVARTEAIAVIRDVLQAAGLDPYLLTPPGLPGAAYLATLPEYDQDVVVADVDDEYATVVAVAGAKAHVARCFFLKAADPARTAERLGDSIFQVITAFESLFYRDFTPSKILITQNRAADPENDEDPIDMAVFRRKIETTLGISVEPINMAAILREKMDLTEAGEPSPVLMNTALSLAAMEILGIRTINFFGEHSLIRKYWEEYKHNFIKTGLIAAFVFVLIMFNVLFEARFLQDQANRLNRRIAFIFQSTFPEVEKIIDPVQQMQTLVRQEQEKTTFSGIIEQEVLNIDILKEISARIPQDLDVELTNFVRGEDNVVISGHTASFNNVDDLKNRLEQADILKNITISSANMEKSTSRIQFKLKIDL